MRPIKQPTFILPTLLRYVALVTIGILGLSYGLWQSRFLIVGPAITVNEPPTIVQNDRIITLSGTAKNATRLYLNGRPIVTDEEGAFIESVILENGPGVVSLDAYDRYGRQEHWEQALVFIDGQSQSIVQR